jgi:hypothetical protein
MDEQKMIMAAKDKDGIDPSRVLLPKMSADHVD